jgi:hypothetical protein
LSSLPVRSGLKINRNANEHRDEIAKRNDTAFTNREDL